MNPGPCKLRTLDFVTLLLPIWWHDPSRTWPRLAEIDLFSFASASSLTNYGLTLSRHCPQHVSCCNMPTCELRSCNDVSSQATFTKLQGWKRTTGSKIMLYSTCSTINPVSDHVDGNDTLLVSLASHFVNQTHAIGPHLDVKRSHICIHFNINMDIRICIRF